MLGRAAYHDPYILAIADQEFFGDESAKALTRLEGVDLDAMKAGAGGDKIARWSWGETAMGAVLRRVSQLAGCLRRRALESRGLRRSPVAFRSDYCRRRSPGAS
jgi:tRNA-dihydrouridine synthase